MDFDDGFVLLFFHSLGEFYAKQVEEILNECWWNPSIKIFF